MTERLNGTELLSLLGVFSGEYTYRTPYATIVEIFLGSYWRDIISGFVTAFLLLHLLQM